MHFIEFLITCILHGLLTFQPVYEGSLGGKKLIIIQYRLNLLTEKFKNSASFFSKVQKKLLFANKYGIKIFVKCERFNYKLEKF